ncbi:tryptophan--tRNA ligase [Stackebrandtia nassauensis]|uniref:Tryptophan--tRNA ligase n=1 Tax=Stackebrandtia nassauensis (strain DSM 44728 / CIP 108903 / NRRL B-16338 / NBRC 102104 / LLR-40K-21) TaxID=446470 RepID=D3PYX2_STANL|nr:tryptophan--tRNA ligase [Stackebrandtia nassauensis]ADD43555.1 tryptophanyl-tRNA synthetase [Stackebrandtia nassauensis DSM 44728]
MTTIATNQLTVPDEIRSRPGTARMLTGDRPTGKLHIGHYFGSLRNRVRLQNQGVDSLVVIADYQVLTDRDIAADLSGHIHEIVLDYLAAGISPQRSTIFTHSAVPALNQLLLPFLSLVSTAELDRNPTVKEEIAAARRASVSGLIYTYPAHQAADILFCDATVVPVGDDQLPHLELTRTIARRFNDRYGKVFTVPKPLLSPAPRLLGVDGRTKMSKSRGNAIALSATADETARLIKSAVTDADRHINYDPANRPGVSNLLLLIGLCTGQEPEQVAESLSGAADLKRTCTEAVNEFFAPLRRRRRELAADPAQVGRIITEGNTRARTIADDTLDRVRRAMGTFA